LPYLNIHSAALFGDNSESCLLAAQQVPLRAGGQQGDNFRQQDDEKVLLKILKKIKR